MRLCCLILLKISGLKGLNVVTYGIISDSFFCPRFLYSDALSNCFTFSTASSTSFNGYFRFLKYFFLIHLVVNLALYFQIR